MFLNFNYNNWLQWVDSLNWLQVAAAILLLTFFLLLRKLFTKYILKFLLAISRKSGAHFATHIIAGFEQPIRVLLIVIGLYAALQALGVEVSATSHASAYHLFRSSLVILIIWGLIHLSKSSSSWIDAASSRFNLELDSILIPLLSKFIRVIIIALGISIIAQEWGYQISAFIAGLGLGGLAFALAAQDVLKNIFGGIVIITEKPFSSGDWIETKSVEGTVEDITFRSTRVRTFAQALVTVPNSTLANEAITNCSKMGRRRITFQLPLTYTTSRQNLENSVNRIRDMLRSRVDIDQQTLFVHFDKFADKGLELYFYFFTKTTVWGEWLAIKEACNLKIMEILEQEGVTIAIPSTSVYFETPLKTSSSPTGSSATSSD